MIIKNVNKLAAIFAIKLVIRINNVKNLQFTKKQVEKNIGIILLLIKGLNSKLNLIIEIFKRKIVILIRVLLFA